MKNIELNRDGSIINLPEEIKQIHSQDFYLRGTTNMTSCSGTNKSGCKNSGVSSDTTNSKFCSNTGTCDSQSFPE